MIRVGWVARNRQATTTISGKLHFCLFPALLCAATVCGTPVVSRLSVYYRDIVAEETSAVYRFSPRYTPNKITQHFTQSAHSYHGSIGPDVDPHLNNQLEDFWISGELKPDKESKEGIK